METAAAQLLRATAAGIGAALLLAGPVAAAGPGVTMEGSVLRIIGTDAADHAVTVSRAGDLVSVVSDTATTSDAPECATVATPATGVRCSGANEMTLIVIRLGSGTDRVEMAADPGAEADIDLGAGGDLFGGGARRSVVRGGDGADFLQDESASSVLDGGAGSDIITPGAGSDDVVGGAGLDMADYSERSSALRISLDGVANDGDAAVGERDNLVDMEHVRGGEGADVMSGDEDINELEGNEGDDRLHGAGGFDRLLGGDGDDELSARDGLAERVECGPGADRAVTDEIDADAGCETVDRSPELQPDRDGDGLLRPADCNDLDATIRPAAFDRPGDGVDADCQGGDAVDLDLDRDGFPLPLDCDDTDRSIRPGAGERLGDFVDEDCDDLAEPFPRITASMVLSTRQHGRVTETVGLVIADLDGGERIVLTCRGRGCRFERRRARAGRRAARIQLDRLVEGMRLQPRVRLRARVRRLDGVKRVLTARMRADAPPKRSARCVAPPGAKVAGC